jgi:hypothetical protein
MTIVRGSRIAALGAVLTLMATPPPAAAAEAAVPDAARPFRCPTARLDGLTPAQAEAAGAALKDVCAILASDAFQARLRAGTWLTGCPVAPWSGANRVEGGEGLARLSEGVPDFTIQAEKAGWSSTIAMTDIATRTMRIRPVWFDHSASPDPAVRALFLNTLAHEMTHLVSPPGRPGAYQFTDSRYWLPWCGRDRMFSYGVGDLVAATWLGASGRAD